MIRWLAVACLCAGPLWAQEPPPEASVRPQARETAEPAEDAAEVSPAPEAPGEPGALPAAEALPPDVAADSLPPGMRDELRVDDREYAACLAVLDSLGMTYTEADPIIPEDDVDCGILRPLDVTEAAPGVKIEPPATVRCATAEAIGLWVRDFVLPASARLEERGKLTTIRNGSGYVCRRRNNAPDGKLSEHAFGNALDVMGFAFETGPDIKVEPREAEGSMAEAFQDAVRASACMEFSTVLGPGSNASHDDHLHLDIIERTRGYRLCEQGGASPD